MVDFGNDLYTPWRLAHGALLYRDVGDNYGPFSQYLNAALFKIFGTGMMVLVGANLVIFTAILVVVYTLFRRAWGKFPAFTSCAIFVAVFGFAQYIARGNYNYATPYAHPATHGMLVSVLLLWTLTRWVANPTGLHSFLAGGLWGLTAVIKPEFMLAGGLITLAAFLVRWRHGKPAPLAAAGYWAAGAVLPTLGFAIYFSAYVPWREALADASRAWLNVASSTRYIADPVQIGFLGLDQPWENLAAHATATLLAALLIAGICLTAWRAERSRRQWEKVLLGIAVVGVVAWVSVSAIEWLNVGRCLLGLTVAYVLVSALAAAKSSALKSDVEILALRLMTGLLAAVLMVRMVLNGRIFHFGFYQAALAGILVPAVVLGELPSLLGFKSWGRGIVVAGALALFVPGVAQLVGKSQEVLGTKTLSIGSGSDQFYSFPKDIDRTGELVRLITKWLGQFPGPQSLVVLPEGEMINYLTRMPNPVATSVFFSAAISQGREEKVVNDLRDHPPDWIVMISRDLHEYGIERYGEAPGKGGDIMRWVKDNYLQALSIGGDPLDNHQGAIVLRRKGRPRPIRP